MANSSRRYTDNKGYTFIPMNVEGGSWNENFMTTPKLVALGGSILSLVLIVAYLKGRYASGSAYIIFVGAWVIAFSYILRYIIFEEKFYYSMYKNLKESEITTPALFWNIAAIKDTEDGALLTYADGKLGIVVKLERDTITGKTKEFKEDHYDAISDFYKEIVDRGYSFVQMNIMERAGNDPRLAELDKLIHKDDNPNIQNLMEKQIGYIKNITHRTLYESDYVIIYTSDLNRTEAIVNDSIDCIYKIFGGAFIGYRILSSRDIIEFVKEQYGVKYFNHSEAMLSMFRSTGTITKKPFNIVGLEFSDGETQEIGNKESNIITSITSGVINGTLDIATISIKQAVFSEKKEEKFSGVDFDSLAKGFEVEKEENVNKKFTINRKNDNPNNNIKNGSDKKFEKINDDKLDIHEQDTNKKKEDNTNDDFQQFNIEDGVSLEEFDDDYNFIDF